MPRLPNAGDDATDVSAALERIGFEVTQVQNADYGQMRASPQKFSADADGTDMALVYYAGHGFEIDGKNHWCRSMYG
ncbi:MAG: caspase family protein [Devosia sp.]|nr:caspase family protein [Devosia sp.]